MDVDGFSIVALRVFREVVERRTLTAAAASLGYTQSAVSRQIATLERAAGTTLFERRRDGVRLTEAGRIMLRNASSIIDRLDATAREISGLAENAETVRLGWITTAGVEIVPSAIVALRRDHPEITVHTREGSTPALVRAVRSGSLDLALLSSAPPFRAPDDESPALAVETVTERSLILAVPAQHRLAATNDVEIGDLHGLTWIGGAGTGEDRRMGVWPGLDERPYIAHTASDWMAKLHLVAAGCGVTTAPVTIIAAAPAGVRFVRVLGGPAEQRRIILARLPGPASPPAQRLAHALRCSAGATVH